MAPPLWTLTKSLTPNDSEASASTTRIFQFVPSVANELVSCWLSNCFISGAPTLQLSMKFGTPFEGISDYDARVLGQSCDPDPLTLSVFSSTSQDLWVIVLIGSSDGTASSLTLQCDSMETSSPTPMPTTINPAVIPPSGHMTQAPFIQPTSSCGDSVAPRTWLQRLWDGVFN